jgi:hypothetical protein
MIILAVILSLLLQQAMGFAMVVSYFSDAPDHAGVFALDTSHHSHMEKAGDSCDSNSCMPDVPCCKLAASACGTIAILIECITFSFPETHRWPLLHSEILFDWSPPIEPRPPRFID